MIKTFDNWLVEAESSSQSAAQQEALVNAQVDDAIEAELKDKTDEATNSSASLKFDGDYLHWLNNGVSVAKWDAYSGLSFGNTPLSDYGTLYDVKTKDPNETSKLKDAGPTPPGTYKLGKLQVRDGVNVNVPATYKADDISFLKAMWIFKKSSPDVLKNLGNWTADSDLSKIGWGDFRIALTPDKQTDTHSRTSMYIHGGAIAGSHGCIDLTDQMPNFAKWYSAWLVQKQNKGKSLILTVEYPKKRPAESNPTYNNSHYSQTTRMGTF